MDYNAALWGVNRTYFYLSAIGKLDSESGLPCFIYYSRIFQFLIKVWCGCYDVAGHVGLYQLECDFLFRWFLLGGVLDNDEIQLILSFALKYCARVREIPETGWVLLMECFRFAGQQRKIEQPWGANCMRWIQQYRL
jgi:hypothetical protein